MGGSLESENHHLVPWCPVPMSCPPLEEALTLKDEQGINIFCRTGFFRGHNISSIERFCRTADFNFRGCRYGAFELYTRMWQIMAL